MPTQPPRYRPPGWREPEPWAASKGKSRQQRGYGREHERMRDRVLAEEPYCRECLRLGISPPALTTVADHIRNQAEGGGADRSNYQGLCTPHSMTKTARESARGRRRARDA
ncbi:MAG TPA: HNH endonuclease [Sphingobium sp.]|uniref:HNH endonuclease n=1 Tax=Sphingobium sp. TaxID=1912891 RepID=UPI002ED3B261